MAGLNGLLLFLLFHLRAVLAFSTSLALDQTWANHQQCIDMSGTEAFQPGRQSSLSILFDQGYEGIVSVVAFELRDEHLGGKYRPGSNKKEVFCTQENIQLGLCDESQLGQFLISDDARTKAHHPFITRAVNLTTPIAVLYPVTSAGYYCAAAIHSTGGKFAAKLTAIEHGRSIPAFRAGLLALYRYFAPIWAGLMLTWTAWRWECPRQEFSRRTGLTWLVPLSTAQVTVHWIALSAGRDGLKLAWTLAWYALSAAAHTCIILNMYQYAMWATSGRWQKKLGGSGWLPYVLALASISLHVASSWADYAADAASKGPVYVNIIFGSSLFAYAGTCAFCLLRGKPMQSPVSDKRRGALLDDTALLYTRPVVGCVIACMGVFFGILAVVNLWTLVVPRPSFVFGAMFWQRRYFLFDGAIEFIFFFWTAVLAVCSAAMYIRELK